MDIIYLKTPENPLDLIITEFFYLNSTIKSKFTNTEISEGDLQDICLKYNTSKSFSQTTNADGHLNLTKLPKHITIDSLSDPEGFRILSEKNMEIGYFFDDFDDKGNYLTISFLNRFNSRYCVLISAKKNICEIKCLPSGSSQGHFDFDRKRYIQKLEKMGLKPITTKEIENLRDRKLI